MSRLARSKAGVDMVARLAFNALRHGTACRDFDCLLTRR